MRVLVLGLAASGRSVSMLLRSEGHHVIGYDQDPGALEDAPVDDAHAGSWDRALLSGVDLVVPSPGVPEVSEVMGDVLASDVVVRSELEVGASRRRGGAIVAVTGTNGKTTVTEMTAAMLRASGVDVVAVGNIGTPLTAAPPAEVLVVEASSFQLRFIDRFRPDAAAIVNFAPDHLDWHPDVAAYGAAKARIFENMRPVDALVFDADDAGAAGLVSSARTRLIGVSGVARRHESGPESGVMHLGGAVVPIADLTRSDAAMLVDLAVAAEAARAVGATPEAIASAAVAYEPGRHRREVVAADGGVTFVDDSKATNPHAALAAIASYPSVVLIAGGRAKGLDVRPLARAETVRGLVAIGESAAVLTEERSDALTADSMEEAVEAAISLSQPGDVVLLAPGCASFDMFDSYGHRGDMFATAVRRKVGG